MPHKRSPWGKLNQKRRLRKYKHKRNEIGFIKQIIRQLAWWDALTREKICSTDFSGPNTGKQIYWQGEVLWDCYNRGSHQQQLAGLRKVFCDVCEEVYLIDDTEQFPTPSGYEYVCKKCLCDGKR